MLYCFPNRPLLISPDSEKVLEYSQDSNWDADIKKNGDRLVLRKTDKFELRNRHKTVLKYKPCPELLDEINSLDIPNNTQLDGELMHNKTKHIKNRIIFYDIYILGNEKLKSTLQERRDIIHGMFKDRKFKHTDTRIL